MLYHRFSNLRDIFQGDLNWKLMDGVISRDFMDLPCNCNNMMKVNGQQECAYNGDCRKICMVYKVTCRKCECFYIGNMQQKVKNHQGQHLDNVKAKANYEGWAFRFFCSTFCGALYLRSETIKQRAQGDDEVPNHMAKKHLEKRVACFA